MPPEIADSDAESDLDVPPLLRHGLSTSTPPLVHAGDHTASLNVNFDNFISPTQKISTASNSQDELLLQGTGSTELLLRGIPRAQMRLGTSHSEQLSASGQNDPSKKRRHTDLEEKDLINEEDQCNPSKRAKTYASKSRTIVTPGSDLFAQTSLEAQELPSWGNEHLLLATADPDIPARGEEVEDTPDAPPRERDRRRRVVSLLGDTINPFSHQISTSVASMGDHQFLNLNYRGTDTGLDVNANPFGTLSQVSLDGDPNTPETARVASLFQNHDNSRRDVPVDLKSVQKDMMTSPAQPTGAGHDPIDSVEPCLTSLNTETQMQRPSKRRKTEILDRELSSPDLPSSRRAASLSTETQAEVPQPKKRGRKAQNSKSIAKSDVQTTDRDDRSEAHSDDRLIGLPKEMYKPRPSRSRRGTTESLSQASHGSQTPNRLKRTLNKTDLDPPSVKKQEERSPAKHPTSELHLSDEAVIGLPKENYQPRPSRSRSKRIIQDDEEPMGEAVKDPELLQDETNPVKPTPTKIVKKGKKSKVKRAKTSAAALLRKSEQMHSDGDEDVLWLEKPPAVVKVDPLPDVPLVKKEKKQDTEEESPEKNTAETEGRGFSLSIPRVIEGPDIETITPAEPKKRGRKAKKTVQPANPEEDVNDKAESPAKVVDELNNTLSSRIILAEKDLNLNPSMLPDKSRHSKTSPPKAVASHVENDEEGDEEEQQQPNNDGNQLQLQPTSTPSKPPAASASSNRSSPEKGGPTKHSPIPVSLSSRSRYRVGLSRRQPIPSLLRKVDKTKEAPKIVARKEKLTKKQLKELEERGEGEGEDGEEGGGGGGGVDLNMMRDKDGNLVEWEF